MKLCNKISLVLCLLSRVVTAEENPVDKSGFSSVGTTGIGPVTYAQQTVAAVSSFAVNGVMSYGSYFGYQNAFLRGSFLAKTSPSKNVEFSFQTLYGMNWSELQNYVPLQMGADVTPTLKLGFDLGRASLGAMTSVRFRSSTQRFGIDLNSSVWSSALLLDYRIGDRISFHINPGYTRDESRNLLAVRYPRPTLDVYRLSTDISDAPDLFFVNGAVRYKAFSRMTSALTVSAEVPLSVVPVSSSVVKVSPVVRFNPYRGLGIDLYGDFALTGGDGMVVSPVWKAGLMLSYSYFPPERVRTVEVQLPPVIVVEKTPVPPIEVCREENRLKTPLVTFDPDTSNLQPESVSVVSNIADLLKIHPEIEEIELVVHTDENGDEKANMEISEQRANKIKGLLTAAGVDPTRLKVKGLGNTKPLIDNRVEIGRSKNRRIEFNITRVKN